MSSQAYSVFARKYRPRTFADVVGQPHVTRTLQNALREGRVGHAYLFSGPRGVGKTTLARILSKALNCVKGPTHEPCDACEPCRTIQEGADADVVEMDAASRRSVEDARHLRENVRYAPLRSRHKVYILDEAHMLTPEAFNTLLKTLEEPPPHVKFIFATTDPLKLPETIRSRCQRFEFRRPTDREIVDTLKKIIAAEKLDVPDGVLRAVALHAQGSLRDAESFLDQIVAFKHDAVTEADVRTLLGAAPEDWVVELVGHIVDQHVGEILTRADASFSDGVDPATLLFQCVAHYRQLLLIKTCGLDSGLVDVPESLRPAMKRQADALSAESILYAIQLLLESSRRLRDGADPRLILELAFAKLGLSATMPALTDLIARAATPRPTEEAAPRPAPKPAPPAAGPVRAEPPAPIRVEAKPTTAYGASDLTKIRDAWPAIVDRAGQASGGLAEFLHHTRPLMLEGDELTILLNDAKMDELRGMADQAKNRTTLESALEKHVGRRLRIRYETPGGSATVREAAKPAPANSADDPGVRAVLDMFPGTRPV